MIRRILQASLSFFLFGCILATPSIHVKNQRTKSLHEYTLYTWEGAHANWTANRPTTDDESVLFCIAAAFTQLNNDEIDGLYSDDGILGNLEQINRKLGGACLIEDGDIQLIDTHKELNFDDTFCEDLSRNDADLFQQILCVIDGKAEKFRDEKLFQRRALVKMNDGSFAIIETMKPASLAQFSVDLVELGADRALYTDMGGWDEGWYRYGNGVIPVGRMKTSTARQSNWLLIVAD